MKIFENNVKLALANLQTGQLVRTKGGTSAGDGGGRTYRIEDSNSTGVVLSNGNVAVDMSSKEIGQVASNTNLLSNHNFLTPSPDGVTPPSSTPTTYSAGTQIFSGVFANETTGITNLTYVDGRVSFSSGDFYIPVANTGGLERLNDFVASVADFDGKPRTRGVSFALVGDKYRVTVGVDALEDVATNPTPLGSVKFEQGSVATGHEVQSFKGQSYTFNTIAEMVLIGAPVGAKVQWVGYYEASDGGSNWGVVKKGAHVEDGGSIFTITPTLYVEANITNKFNIKKFGVMSDGSQADVTDRFEAAIALRKKIKCNLNSTYNLGKIVPNGFTWIDFNHSTVDLIPNTNAPLFYDSRAGSSTVVFENFTVMNLKYNGKQEDGNSAANANGCIWLSNWKNVRIENLEVDNCMRIGLNIRGCDRVKIHDYTYKNGGFDAAPTYCYGWTLEETSGNGKCRNIDMKNIKVDSSRGYGGHFNGCQKAVIKNYETIGLNYLSSSISFTITSSNEIDITNYTANQTSGDSLEINDSTSVTLDNFTISNSGNRGIIFGDNFTGNDGSDVAIRNGQITGSTNADLALNRVKRLSFENMRLSKGDVSVIASEDLIRASDISFTNVEFNSEISSALGGQYRFAFRNCNWLDIIGVDCSLTNDLWSSPKNNTDEEGYLIVPSGGAINLPPLSRISRVRGPFIGELRITSTFPGNTDQHSLITYYLSKISTSLQITQGPEIYGSVTNRKMTVTQGGTSDNLVLTNNTSDQLRVVWALHTY